MLTHFKQYMRTQYKRCLQHFWRILLDGTQQIPNSLKQKLQATQYDLSSSCNRYISILTQTNSTGKAATLNTRYSVHHISKYHLSRVQSLKEFISSSNFYCFLSPGIKYYRVDFPSQQLRQMWKISRDVVNPASIRDTPMCKAWYQKLQLLTTKNIVSPQQNTKVNRRRRKGTQLAPPMQQSRNLQWWSNQCAHLPQRKQWQLVLQTRLLQRTQSRSYSWLQSLGATLPAKMGSVGRTLLMVQIQQRTSTISRYLQMAAAARRGLWSAVKGKQSSKMAMCRVTMLYSAVWCVERRPNGLREVIRRRNVLQSNQFCVPCFDSHSPLSKAQTEANKAQSRRPAKLQMRGVSKTGQD